MEKKQVIGILSSAMVLLAVVGFVTPAHADAYNAGWRNGYADHVRGGPYINLAISPSYSQGYNDGWNAWSN